MNKPTPQHQVIGLTFPYVHLPIRAYHCPYGVSHMCQYIYHHENAYFHAPWYYALLVAPNSFGMWLGTCFFAMICLFLGYCLTLMLMQWVARHVVPAWVGDTVRIPVIGLETVKMRAVHGLGSKPMGTFVRRPLWE